MVTVKPKEWKNGSTPTMRSLESIQKSWAMASIWLIRL